MAAIAVRSPTGWRKENLLSAWVAEILIEPAARFAGERHGHGRLEGRFADLTRGRFDQPDQGCAASQRRQGFRQLVFFHAEARWRCRSTMIFMAKSRRTRAASIFRKICCHRPAVLSKAGAI